MKVVVNALAYKQNSSGIGVLIRELFARFSELTSEPCEVILSKDSPPYQDKRAGTEQIRCPYRRNQTIRRNLFQCFRFGRVYCHNSLLLTTDSKIPFFLPRNCRVLPLITDLAVYRMGWVYRWPQTVWWRLQYQYVQHKADRYLTISEFTKREIMDLLKIPEDRIDVIYCAGNPTVARVTDPMRLKLLREKYGLPSQYVLFVGNFNPRKNLQRLMQAFDLLKERTDLPHQLVIAGEQGWKFDRRKALDGLKHPDEIRFLGFVPDEDLPTLYSGADLFVFPTLYEGFGIPVVEAQACGTPVVASGCSSLPEVAGDGALFVDPENTESICTEMVRVLKDPALAESLAERGYQNSRRFSWKASAEKLSRVVEKMIREGTKLDESIH